MQILKHLLSICLKMKTSSENSSSAKYLRFVRGLVCNSKKMEKLEIVCRQTALVTNVSVWSRLMPMWGSPSTLGGSLVLGEWTCSCLHWLRICPQSFQHMNSEIIIWSISLNFESSHIGTIVSMCFNVLKDETRIILQVAQKPWCKNVTQFKTGNSICTGFTT